MPSSSQAGEPGPGSPLVLSGQGGFGRLDWGLTAAPITYAPRR